MTVKRTTFGLFQDLLHSEMCFLNGEPLLEARHVREKLVMSQICQTYHGPLCKDM